MAEISRREGLTLALGGAAALSMGVKASAQTRMIMRPVPKTGEMLPVIGLGSSATFSQVAQSEDVSALRAVLQTLVDSGGSVFDTAPSYGASEETAGRIATEAGIANRLFWATKVNVVRGGAADSAAAKAQIEQSFARIGQPKIDLIQVHNVGDPATQLPILADLKAKGRIRYFGITSTSENQYPTLISVMRNEPIDFIGIDYAVDNREVETTILPLALQRKIGVFVYAPFGRTRLFRRVGERPLPDWATDIDAKSWAQVMLKWIIGHPAITVVTPATSQPKNMIDNLGGGVGRIPDAALRERIAAFIGALPQAS
ncbi:aryl-alcohol dehydrogenase-like predicted oxidoreductase [Sphingobium sp. B1D7B]|uniref:aldo/keto reductase n=1 Tax=Sphingobium sp. B1D7B TaxID=2940578 RepID=UPI002224BE95|nr:aldo/keto reductase [Sphingobium sp. B1D7B]MCW2404635.1 aryl-alcohol dehydrogenase-like predicted oxidoreductase [Sphingobium sp. B1D7B]